MQAGHGQPQGRKQLTPSKTYVGFFLESLLSLSKKSACGTYIMCEDIWLRLKAAALSRWLTESVGLVLLLLHVIEGFGHRLPVSHTC